LAGYGIEKIAAAEQTELDGLRKLYPDLPPDPDGLMMMRNLEAAQRGSASAHSRD
jgi:hypothetical protein